MDYMSPSRAHLYDNCPRGYRYRYVDGWRPATSKANLVFGGIVHQVLAEMLTAHAYGEAYQPEEQFIHRWREAIQQEEIEFSSKQTPEKLEQIGRTLVQRAQTWWTGSGYEVVLDRNGELMIERRLSAEVRPGLKLLGELDLVVMDHEGRIGVLDWKTPARAGSDDHVLVSEQLLIYEVLFDHNAEGLGLEPAAFTGFVNLTKQAHPKVVPEIRKASSAKQRAELLEKLGWMVSDIRGGRFPRRPRMAWNTPCPACEYVNLCLYGVTEGLTREK